MRFEDRNTVRHTDEWWMNHRNTWGRLTYMKDMAAYPTPTTTLIDADLVPVPRDGAIEATSTSKSTYIAANEGLA